MDTPDSVCSHYYSEIYIRERVYRLQKFSFTFLLMFCIKDPHYLLFYPTDGIQVKYIEIIQDKLGFDYYRPLEKE